MASSVFSGDPGALTTDSTYIGDADTDDGVAVSFQGSSFAFQGDSDDLMLTTEQGAAGLVGPVTGAQNMPNAAQPGSTSI